MIPTKEQRTYNRERKVSSKNGIGENIQKRKKEKKEGKKGKRKKIKISHKTQNQNMLKI